MPLNSDAILSPQLQKILVCPRDRSSLRIESDWLVCESGHRYRVVDGIPIFLLDEVEQTHYDGKKALIVAETGVDVDPLHVNMREEEIDKYVNLSISATNGSLYQHLVGNLREYPIPRLRLPPGNGQQFIEIGCNWGR